VDNFSSAQPIVDNSYPSFSLASRSERGVITRTYLWSGRGRLVAQRGGKSPHQHDIEVSVGCCLQRQSGGGDYPKMPAVAPFPVSESEFFIVGRLGGGRLPVNWIIMEPQIRSSISKGGANPRKAFCERQELIFVRANKCLPLSGRPRVLQKGGGNSPHYTGFRRFFPMPAGGKSPNPRKLQNLYIRSRSSAV
jgi:hypothetical protein